jgi:hypothetical protein
VTAGVSWGKYARISSTLIRHIHFTKRFFHIKKPTYSKVLALKLVSTSNRHYSATAVLTPSEQFQHTFLTPHGILEAKAFSHVR